MYSLYIVISFAREFDITEGHKIAIQLSQFIRHKFTTDQELLSNHSSSIYVIYETGTVQCFEQ